jgi:hypothetical protein
MLPVLKEERKKKDEQFRIGAESTIVSFEAFLASLRYSLALADFFKQGP